MASNELLTLTETAQRLGVSRYLVRDMIDKRQLPVVWVGNRKRVPARAIDSIIAAAITEVTTAAVVGSVLGALGELDRQGREDR